ncbi:Serine/threonine-protein phosphatase 2A activator 2 [Lecanora helva]
MPSAVEPDHKTINAKHAPTSLSPEELSRLPRLTPRKKKPSTPHKSPSIPRTEPLPAPPELSKLSFVKPTRRIIYPSDHDRFLASPTHTLILSFVFSLSEAAADKSISSIDLSNAHPSVRRILSILDSIEETLTRWPPVEQGGSRFGNPAFRQFVDEVYTQASSWHTGLDVPSEAAVTEVVTYLEQSFGNRTRIDYGSGHELNFITWLLCLNRLSLLPESTFPALALRVFPRYVKLMRRIQSTYYLEPAGSHGVWGLDDYHFLPFLFGASQLLHHPYIRPLAIHNDLVLEEEGDEYLYLDMVRFTMASKTVKGLKWTQPMLDDISGAKSWEKVEQGMRKMFIKEVLGKLPIMQHFMFGSLVPATEGMSVDNEKPGPENGMAEGGEVHIGEDGTTHVHRNDAWGDCCGIKIPSTVAASEESRKLGENDGLRRIPFD